MIQPYLNKIQIKIEQPKAGALDLSSKETGTEIGEVVALGFGCDMFKVGDKLMFKAWALDVITYEGEKYYFINADSEGICAIIK